MLAEKNSIKSARLLKKSFEWMITLKKRFVGRAFEFNLLAKLINNMQILHNYISHQRACVVMSFNFSHQSVSNWVEMEVCTQTARIAICVPALAVKYSLLLLYRASACRKLLHHTAVTITISHDIAAAQVLLPAAFQRAIINYSAAERICSTYAHIQNYTSRANSFHSCFESAIF